MAHDRFLAGGGEMGERMRAMDWASTKLGPIETWSPALKTLTSIMLANRFPMLLWWGPESVSIYNDAYIPVLGVKHPQALGQPVAEVWTEIYDVLRPLILTPLNGGPPTWSEDLLLEIRRHGFLEETHWTVAYSPVPDDTVASGIGGVLATVHEITAQIVGTRRNGLLRDLGARASDAKSTRELCLAAAETVAMYPDDVPFAGFYVLEAGAAQLVAGDADAEETWPIEAVLRSHTAQHLPERGAIVLPIESDVAVVVGLSPRLAFDDDYRVFVNLLATQLGSSIANARAYELERRRAESLAEIDRAKTAFFSNVSHEFRTPLTLMLGHVEDSLDDATSPLSSPQRERQETVQRNALRLLKLVNALLDFSRIEAGRAQAMYEPTDLSALTAQTASAFQSLVEGGGLTLTIDTPPLAEPVYVDRSMWEKIVLNLISNAYKFTLAGEITVRLESDGEEVRLSVIDTGSGIDAKHLPHIFERFYRVEGAVGRTHEGSGIGLALVREVAKLHGGTASVESTEGKGTTVSITIAKGSEHLPSDQVQRSATHVSPAERVRSYVEEAAGWAPNEAPTTGTFAPVGDASLLVADDNADMRDYLTRLLRPLGRVTSVKNGREALAAIAESLPDLVLSDVMMPDVDGIELVRALRAGERTQTLPIILVSARAGEDSRVDGASIGADDYIVKPFSARELVAKVAAQLAQARLRHEYTQALMKSEGQFRALVTAVSDVVYRMNADWSEMKHLVGRDFIPDTEDPNRSWLEKYIHPDDQPRVLAAIREAIRSKTTFNLEHRVLRVDGTLGWTRSRAVALLDRHGEIVEWLGTAEDVTDDRVKEQRLRDANALLADADQRKNEFLAMLSHELRNPLTPIAAGLALLKDLPPGDARSARALAVMDRQVGQLSNLVNDLLDVTRIERNKVELHTQRLELNEIARRAVEDSRAFFEKANVRLELSPAKEDVFVVADATRLGQVIGNLLHNAAKFTTAGGLTHVSVAREGREAVVRVTDDGVGMSGESLAHLFEPFVQVRQTLARSQGGLGLGLALVKRLVELHGGVVSARSDGIGKGTEVMIRLPVDRETREKESTPPPSTISGRRRVLVIEDNLDAAELLREALGHHGHEVAIAHNGLDGLEEARRFRPHVVLCDIGLPGMDGYDVARAIRADASLSRRLDGICGARRRSACQGRGVRGAHGKTREPRPTRADPRLSRYLVARPHATNAKSAISTKLNGVFAASPRET